ncbi:MAG: 4Fe-4S ferredoxin [Desulfarculus sp.]|nr:4Fe-4S ferredoxin [Desulfarculus sp.]
MSADVYKKLAQHLDSLPAGFPATEDGVELRILSQLFTPEQAALAVHLGLKLEKAEAIAQRAGLPVEEAAKRLQEMSRQGLIFSIESPERPPVYMASQFVVGIWEYNLNRMTPQFVADVEAYMPHLSQAAFGVLPQLRTIPVGKSLSAAPEVLAYESAEALIRQQEKILVAPCICRKEHQIKGGGCGKLEEACLVFGWGAEYYDRNSLGRFITQDEALGILAKAEEEGLVVQPSNSQDIVNICLCCGDCCQALKHLKRHPVPAQVVVSPFVAKLDGEACIGCEVCLDRCQMGAFSMEDDKAMLDTKRCIGCGLCISTCAGEALSLERKAEQPQVPRTVSEAMVLRAKTRQALADKLARHQNL